MGVVWKKQASRDKRKTSTVLQCVSCTEVEILLKFYVFLLASLRFSFYSWIPDTRGGEVKKNTLCTLRVSGEVARIRRLSLTRILTPANCRKVFGNVWLKRGDVSFCLV